MEGFDIASAPLCRYCFTHDYSMKTYNVFADFILPMAATAGFVYIKGWLASSGKEDGYAIAKVPAAEYMALVESYLKDKEFYFEILGGVGYFVFSDLKKTRKEFLFEGEYIARNPKTDMSLISTYPIFEWVPGKSESCCDMERG